MTVVQDAVMRVLEKELLVLRFEVIALPKESGRNRKCATERWLCWSRATRLVPI